MKREKPKAKLPKVPRVRHRTVRQRGAKGHFTRRPFTVPGSSVRIPTLGALAIGLHASPALVSLVLSGRRKLSTELGIRWAALMGISFERLWLRLYGSRGVVPAKSLVRKAMQARLVRIANPIGSSEVEDHEELGADPVGSVSQKSHGL